MSTEQTRVPSGVPGFDDILHGGLPPNHVYLLGGVPGTGKTTFGLQFLLEGVRRGEKVIYITLLQDQRTVAEMAVSHGWDMTGVHVCSMVSSSEVELRAAEQTLLPSSEVQLNTVIDAIKEAVDRIKPARVVLDSIEQLRLLAGDPAIFHQKILALQMLLEANNATSIFVATKKEDIETLAHGSISLEMMARPYGELLRRLLVLKMRGVSFVGGYCSFRIQTGGIEVFPRLPRAGKMAKPEFPIAASGVVELDAMLGGGLTFGTSCLISGQAGTGKSSLATTYAFAAAKRGQRVAIFLFDERGDILVKRAKGLGMNLTPLIEKGLITLQRVAPGEISGDEFAHRLRAAVEQHEVKMMVMDSLTGYASAMSNESELILRLHDTVTYLGDRGVLTLITTIEHGIVGTQVSNVDASYIADSVVLIRRFEAIGAVRLAVSVIKTRTGDHEKNIRELQITSHGIVVGQPLTNFQGVLTGVPTLVGSHKKSKAQ